MEYVNIALSLPLPPFIYRIPTELSGKVLPGMRVIVPFSKRKLVGFVLDDFKSQGTLKNEQIKDIIEILDTHPVIDKKLLDLAKWISNYYFTPIGLILPFFIPATKLTKKLKQEKQPQKIDDIPAEFSCFDLKNFTSPHVLTNEQQKCLGFIQEHQNQFAVILIHGITGSGKTEIYIQAIAKILAIGKQAIVLVPEIALTPQTISRFKCRFGDNIAVLHSRLGNALRQKEWWRIKNNEAQVVIGARSAVFAPLPRLGIIVIDEEHESSYKQDEAPRYHARDVAIMRAKFCQAQVILGSATPSLESFQNVQKGKYKLFSLYKRPHEKSELPAVEIVDMRSEIAKGNFNPFSSVLLDNIKISLERKEQVILFQNRRGFSSFILCRKCGKVIKCKNCEVSLTYYLSTKKLTCHYCGYSIQMPTSCPNCKSEYLRHFGLGTEKVEEQIKEIFPEARISRLDMNISSKKGELERILNEFREHKIDILIGTQIIAKGHDFPNVTLVGIIFADITLNLPDFRASERTFQLLTQVAGRAGRGLKPGKVIIQTHTPDHYSIKYACEHNYIGFFEEEIKYRKALFYPPFSYLINILFKGKDFDNTLFAAQNFYNIFNKLKLENMQILGPAPAVISKIKNYNRIQIILKSNNRTQLSDCLKKTWNEYQKRNEKFRSIKVLLDVDPQDLI